LQALTNTSAYMERRELKSLQMDIASSIAGGWGWQKCKDGA